MMMFCIRPFLTVYFYLLCSSAPIFRVVHAMGFCEFDDVLAKRFGTLNSGPTASETTPTTEIDDAFQISTTTDGRSTTHDVATAEASTTKRKSSTVYVQTTANDLTSTENQTTHQESTTEQIQTTSNFQIPTTEPSSTKRPTTTKILQTTTSDKTTSAVPTTEQKTTTKGSQRTTNAHTSTTETTSTRNPSTVAKFQTTKSHPTTTEVQTTEKETTTEPIQSTTDAATTTERITTAKRTTTEKQQTTTPIYTTKLTTSVTTTENWSTKITTTELSTFRPTTSLTCPTNMIYTNCTCQNTCGSPNACYKSCTIGEACQCPDGFYVLGEDCVPPEGCGCYVQNEDIIIEEGDVQLVFDCTQSCSCSSGSLSCNNYQCDDNAECKNVSVSGFQCLCLDGYYGNGSSCTRLTDCNDVYDAGLVGHGVYTILPTNWTFAAFDVYCKDRWTVFQRRQDGSVDFNRYWNDYKGGFGNPDGEFWLGLEALLYLTNQGVYMLKIDLTSYSSQYEINHSLFRIDSEGNNYALLELGSYSGNVGADLMDVTLSFQFSTRDRDNDNHPDVDCSGTYQGGWWYKQCYQIFLNGPYGSTSEPGICFRRNSVMTCGVSFTEMSIIPSFIT